MRCPQCPDELLALEYDGVTVRACNGCGGEFLAADQLEAVRRTQVERYASNMQTLLSECVPERGVALESARGVCCPSCGEPMSVLGYGGRAGVLAERCGSCGGIWIDGQELERIALLQERWSVEVPGDLKTVAEAVEAGRRRAAERGRPEFRRLRFAFVTALVNRFLDAA
jgi:Zn-finger nucleic acid-binding protein